MKKHTKFVACALAGFMVVSAINVPSVYAEEIPTETVVDTTNNSATDTTTETPTDSTADSSTETSTNKTTTVKKATATKKQTVKIKKYKKSKKLYVKKATKAYKVTSTGKLKVAKSLKKSAKVTVVGTATVKKVKYYAIKSGKSTLLVKQSLLSKTKPKTAKPSSNKPSSKPSSNSSGNSSGGGSSNSSTSKHPIPQNNTPSGYKGPTNWYGKVDKYGNSPERDIKTVKVVDGKVEYRDIDGKIKYGKCKYIWGGYSYWYTMKDGDGFWMPIENTDLEYWDESDIQGAYSAQQMVDSYYD